MRELRNCDFCAGDAAGTFEIVPPELEPTETEQRRVVCCPDCKARLETLLEPLLARAGVANDHDSADRERDSAHRERAATGDADLGDGSRTFASADEPTQQRSDTARSNATASEAAGDVASTATEDESESPAEAGSGSGSLLEDGITFERSERTDEAAVDSAEVAELVDGVEAETAADDADAIDDARPGGNAESTDSPNRPPTAYNKVIRLLRNREFPMKRSAVEELAAGAYDLESHEVEAIVDHAVEDGEFDEKRGELRRP